MSDPAPVGASCDLAICGGGMVGASLALALAPLDLEKEIQRYGAETRGGVGISIPA